MSDAPLPPVKKKCHCTGFAKSCRALVKSGACDGRWQRVEGKHPQTGARIERWDCVDNHIPVLLMSIGKAAVEAGAATESFRNQFIKFGRKQIAQRDEALKRLPGSVT